jgi:acyl-CoA thioester hydrolase
MTFDSTSDAQGGHVWPLRVYYEDTDAGGVVYYANYLKFAERARTEILRAGGFDHTVLASEFGVQIVVRNCAADYIAPARLDDALEVRSRIVTMGAASFTIRQEVVRPDDAEFGDTATLLVALDVRLACIDKDFRPARLPEPLKKALGHINAI